MLGTTYQLMKVQGFREIRERKTEILSNKTLHSNRDKLDS